MLEFAICVIALLLAISVIILAFVPRTGNAKLGLAPLGCPYSLPYWNKAGPLPYYQERIPVDATHVLWLMVGSCPVTVEAGNATTTVQRHKTYSMMHQSLESAMIDISRFDRSRHMDFALSRALTMEDEMYSRGCRPVSDMLIGLARIDKDGNESWWTGSKWVSRWDPATLLFDIWGQRTECQSP
jgi:hypothetical protein